MSGFQPLIIDQGLIQAVGDKRVEIKRLNFGPLTTINVTTDTIIAQQTLHFLNATGVFTINVDFILDGEESDLLILGGNNIRLRSVGNLSLSSNLLLQPGRSIVLLFVAGAWFELSRTT